MNTFTPGPWHLEGSGASISITDTERLEPIAVFSGADRIGNATLAAAAPDLLTALNDLVMFAIQGRGAIHESAKRARAILDKLEHK